MAICPECNAEIDNIRNFQKTEACFTVRLGKGGDIHYDKDDYYDGCCEDWGFAECPNCGADLGIYSDADAMEFLSGKGNQGKVPISKMDNPLKGE